MTYLRLKTPTDSSLAKVDRVNGTQQRRESRAADIGKRRKNKFTKKRPERWEAKAPRPSSLAVRARIWDRHDRPNRESCNHSGPHGPIATCEPGVSIRARLSIGERRKFSRLRTLHPASELHSPRGGFFSRGRQFHFREIKSGVIIRVRCIRRAPRPAHARARSMVPLHWLDANFHFRKTNGLIFNAAALLSGLPHPSESPPDV
jgi:hypothetical protein